MSTDQASATTAVPTPSHLTLGDLIARLRAEPDHTKRVKVGFSGPHSFRGDYADLAFELVHNITVVEMLAAATGAVGATFQGWKGGDYTMTEHTSVWLVAEPGSGDGETIGAVLLDLMLANVATEDSPPATAPAAPDGFVLTYKAAAGCIYKHPDGRRIYQDTDGYGIADAGGYRPGTYATAEAAAAAFDVDEQALIDLQAAVNRSIDPAERAITIDMITAATAKREGQ